MLTIMLRLLISDLEYDRLKSKYEKFLQENPKFVELDDLGVGQNLIQNLKKLSIFLECYH